MAIPLPQLTFLPISAMPQIQGEIPTAKDIAKADDLVRHVRESQKNMTNTEEDLGNAIMYKAKLVAAGAGGGAAPIWFGPAIANALETALRPIRDDIRTIKADVETLKQESAKTRRLAARSHNGTVGYSPTSVYEIVPFQNGQDPTTLPHNLPPLTSIEAILDLNDRQLDSYLRNYHPHLNNRRVVRNRNERVNLISSAIGIGKIID